MTMQDAIPEAASHDRDRAIPAPGDLQARLCRAIPSTFLLLALLILLLPNHAKLLGDPDSLWHIAVGRWIWEHGRVPVTDLYSHTFAGAPWIAKEWLSQLIFFGIHRLAGWWGVVALTAASIGLAFVVLHEWLLRRLCPPVAIAATLIAIVLCSVHFVARPHILVLPILVVWMAAIVSALDRGRAPPLALALLMALWANMHGSFPLGIAMAGLLASEGVLLKPRGERVAAMRDWAPFMVATGAAVFATPYGWHAIMVPLKMGDAGTTMRYIEEWQPLALDVQGCVALGVLLAAPMLMARNAKAEAFRILAVVLVGYMMIRHVRFISLFGVISIVLVARTLACDWGMGRNARWQPPAFLVGLLVPSVLTVLFYGVTMRPEPDPKVAPAAALQAAMARGMTGPVYNDYNFGGYLIDRGVKTFVDGRTDQLFLGDFLPRLQNALDDSRDDDFARILAHYRVTWALVTTGSRDARHLARMPGWSKVYEDHVASAFVAGG